MWLFLQAWIMAPSASVGEDGFKAFESTALARRSGQCGLAQLGLVVRII